MGATIFLHNVSDSRELATPLVEEEQTEKWSRRN